MSQSTRYTFLVHAIVAAIMGILLLLIPGEFLPLFGWPKAGIDPLVSRVLGAAILAFGWSSYRGWRALDWGQVRIIVEAEVVFTVLAVLGMLRHIIGFEQPFEFWINNWPFGVWLIFFTFVAFAIAFIVALRRK
ncbi:MAG: hypothetical protein ACK2T3_05250 [Candidatus Promineifilaceae bacterium]|jgi:hypothetical protein